MSPAVEAAAKPCLKGVRFFTTKEVDPFDAVAWVKRDAVLMGADGSEKFRQNDIEVPSFWSERATNIVAEKYFRVIKGVKESSVKQMIRRISSTIADAAVVQGIYLATEDAFAFEAELRYMLLHQFFSFNSPVWFNVGVTKKPQASACFIQSVEDTMESITALAQKEIRLFKGGSGTGSNLSPLRSSYEKLKGGGYASGPVSFMEMYDAGAGVTKSGGTCLAPYQKVYTAEGLLTIQEIAERGSDVVVLSYDPPAKRYKAKVGRAWKAGHKQVVRVVTDKGEFHTSLDHPFRLSTGEYCKAEDLEAGKSLWACSIDLTHGHLRVNLRDGQKGKEFFHRIVVQDVKGVDLTDKVVHHLDGNKLNNHPANLAVMTQNKHASAHNLEIVTRGTHVFQQNTYPKSGAANSMAAEAPFWNDAEKVAAYKQKQAEGTRPRAKEMQKAAAEQKLLNTAFKVLNAGYSIDVFEAYIEGRKLVLGRVPSITKVKRIIEGRFGTYENFVRAVAENNHRVVCVEAVGEMDVYDLEVDCPTVDDKTASSGHNFVIWAGPDLTGSGVVVSNTRRAAKMVMLNADHPDILIQQNGRPGFITCKSSAEQLARDLFSTGKYSAEFNVPGNIYERVGFQNANNSVRASDEFMRAVEKDAEWHTKKVTTGEVLHTYKAKGLFDEIVKAAWECGDPGMQFDTTINDWHTCPNTGRINGSNPCSEFMFLDDTACNLGSFNLMKFHNDSPLGFDLNGFTHACEVATTAMEVLVDLAGYPGEEIGKNSHDYRPLGLGYANLGALLMVSGLAYDSPKGRALAAAITAIMSGVAYRQSARLAEAVGPFPGYEANAGAMLHVILKHSKAVDKIDDEGLKEHVHLAIDAWAEALALGKRVGFRNSQISVLAPTGTISFLMDCDTTGVEPALALVQYKKLVGGGQMKMANRLVSKALTTLGYSTRVITSLEKCIAETGDVVGCEGLKPKDRDVFATAIGTNAILPAGHLKMMAAVQPFISGAISKTVNLPSTATLEDVNKVYMAAWMLGLKAVAIYRDGCKLSQPAGTKVDGLGKSLPEAPPAPLWGDRKRMPTTRQSVTHKMQIGEHEGYVTVGLHEDGTPGEVFITMAQEGSALRGFMDLAATSISLGLQHGVPLEVLAHKMQGLKFEPSGFTQNPAIRMAQSIPDYIGRWLEQQFLKGEPAAPVEALSEEVLHKEVVTQGYSGPPCSKCANLTVRSGTCFVCTQCGTTTGCG